jgi:fluoride exporter
VRLIIQIGLVSLGSAAGGLARWGVATGVSRVCGTAFPWGTLVVNLTGTLFLGWFSTIMSERLFVSPVSWLRPDDLRLMVAIGFTGAYTTFSTLEYESNNLLRQGDGLAGMTYLMGSLFLGPVAVRVGIWLAR